MKPALLTYPYVASYPVMMLLGFFAGWLVARLRAPGYGIRPAHLDNISLLLPIAGVFGARFFARLFYAKLSLFEALKVWQGDGLVFYGGFIFGIGTVLLYGGVRRIPLLKLCDCLAPTLAIGLAFGRIGCFLGGCCWGDICVDSAVVAKLPPTVARQIQTIPQISGSGWPLAVRFPPKSDPYQQHLRLSLIDSDAVASLPVHPVQLYESALAAALALLLHRRFRGQEKPASASIALLAGYAVIRFATEFLRADNKEYKFGLTISQVISVDILVFCALALLVSAWWQTRRRSGMATALPLSEQPAGGIV